MSIFQVISNLGLTLQFYFFNCKHIKFEITGYTTTELQLKYLTPGVKLKVAQSCLTLCDPMDCFKILQARILERVPIPFSRGSSQPRDRTQVSHIACGFFTSWATREAQEYLSGKLIPSPVDLPDPGIKPGSPALQADSLPTELPGKP